MYIHIGGSFKHDRDGNLRYIDGECDTWQVNPDLLTIWEFHEKVRIGRYDVDLVEGIYYLEPNKSLDDGLKQIIGDDTVREVLDVMKGHGEVHIYVDHIPNFAEIVPVSTILMLPTSGDPLEPGGGVCSDDGGGVCSDVGGGVCNDAGGGVFSDAGGSRINEDEAFNEVGEMRDNNSDEQDAIFNEAGSYRSTEHGDHFVAGSDVQNDCFPQQPDIDNVEEPEENEYEHGLENFPELSDNEDEETILARDNLRHYSSTQQHANNINIAIQGEDDAEIHSGDEVSYQTTSDEEDSEAEHGVRRKARHPVFDESEGNQEIELGMIFLNKKQFKKAVGQLSIREGREITWKKNDKLQMRAVCKNEKCDWKILLAMDIPTNSWMVKTFYNCHTCSRTITNKGCTSSVAADHLVKTRGVASLRMNRGDVFEAIRDDLGVELTPVQRKKTKDKLKKKFESVSNAAYSRLFDYANELKSKDPEASVVLQCCRQSADTTPTFLRMYVYFSALKKGFLAGCRRVIGVDDAFLKGAYKGELLTTVVRDVNNQMYPIAWAVVEVEKRETWEWFFEELRKDLLIGDGSRFCIMSDQQKVRLVKAVEELFPCAEHRFCARHKYNNFRKQHKGKELQKAFWKCVKARTVPEFSKALDELTSLKPSTRETMFNTDPKHWCRAFFQTETKSNIVDNNMCEVFNGLLVESRHKAIVSLHQDLRAFCGQRTVARREFGDRKFVDDFGPRTWEKLVANTRGSRRCKFLWPGSNYYEVQENGADVYMVNVDERKCTCKEWDLIGIPCRHAMVAINARKEKAEDYVSDWYRKEKFKAAYEYAVPVTEGMNQWEKTRMPPVQPPPARKMPGRPKGKRVLEEWEGHTNMSRKGRQMTCQKCFQKGHNSRKCKAQGPTTAPQPKNANASEEQVPVEDSQHPKTVTENDDSQIPLSQVVNPMPVNDPMSVQNQNEENTNPATVQQQKNRVQIPAKRQNKKGQRSSESATANPPAAAPHATVETPQQPKKKVKTTAKEPPRHRAKSVGNRSNQ
ncbi:hypothetical protein SLEP1_g56160 [Rubroshorea leprosula]|uniref:SWIM-type domain-containing protein n=1 Tax=Rubroshorea leprosula TaxID=152421 RepID=A0AAV5MJV6_9ROSI|nr:hypothetical protein SLEP1_g56160 [Rubroshorea leprosula]